MTILFLHHKYTCKLNCNIQVRLSTYTDTTHPLHPYSEVSVYDDAYYKCKWQCPLDKLIVTEPDYANDIWDYVVREGTCIL